MSQYLLLAHSIHISYMMPGPGHLAAGHPGTRDPAPGTPAPATEIGGAAHLTLFQNPLGPLQSTL